MNMKMLSLYGFVFVGLLYIGISIPLIMGKVPPNAYYGFRTAKTMSNPDIWYKANAYSGWALLVSGVVIALATIALAYVPDLSATVYTYCCLAVMVITLIISTVLSFIYLRTL